MVAEAAGLFEALSLDRVLLGLLDLRDLVLELFEVGRGLHALDAQARAGLVDQVDGLVGQVAIGDVAVGQVRRGHQRLVGDGDAVVGLVAVAQALQDLDRVGHRGLLDLDRLEAALERGVLLEVLAVLVERGGADRLQLTAGQHRLQDRRGVDGAFGRTRTDERVDLVDEQDDVSARTDLFEDLLEALLEVAPVARAGDERAEIERVELLVLEGVGDVVDRDLLGEALDDRGLADAGLADEHRVVLRAPAQHLHHALELAPAPDDRVELLLAGELGEVAAELVEHERALARRLGRRARRAAGARRAARLLATGLRSAVAGQELDHLLAHPRQIGSELHEHLGRDALALADEAEEDVLGADVVVAELKGLAEGELQHLLRPGREGDVARRGRPALADDLFDLVPHRLQRNAERFECLGRDALTLVDEAEEDVLGADVVVVEQARFFLRQHHDSSSPVSEAFEQGNRLCRDGGTVRRVYRRSTRHRGRE